MSKDILVIAEHFQGRLCEITFELLGKARELAQSGGGKAVVALLGEKPARFVGELGAADRVLMADRTEFREFTPEAFGAVLEAMAKEVSPRLLLLGCTSAGLDLLSWLSVRLNCPCVDSCTRLVLREGLPVATCQIYGGKLFAEVTLPETPTLVAIVPGSSAAEAGKLVGNPEVVNFMPPALPAPRVAFKNWIEPPPGDVDITRMPVLVAVGRGIQNQDNLALAEELAAALEGAVCASRPVIDQGWLPLTRQVGKSGMTVKPKAYLAFGISGAPEHLEGMKQSELIFAVNTDPKAPIFSIAHFGAVADAVELLPVLTEEVRKAAVKKA